jgi:hypothetical protein
LQNCRKRKQRTKCRGMMGSAYLVFFDSEEVFFPTAANEIAASPPTDGDLDGTARQVGRHSDSDEELIRSARQAKNMLDKWSLPK